MDPSMLQYFIDVCKGLSMTGALVLTAGFMFYFFYFMGRDIGIIPLFKHHTSLMWILVACLVVLIFTPSKKALHQFANVPYEETTCQK